MMRSHPIVVAIAIALTFAGHAVGQTSFPMITHAYPVAPVDPDGATTEFF